MSKLKWWTGIGSREVSEDIRELQIQIGEVFASLGYILLSGGAGGSDDNFHEGVCNVDPTLADIYLPWAGFREGERTFDTTGSNFLVPESEEEFRIAKRYLESDTEIITWFDKMGQGAQRLHCRNYYQIFGERTDMYAQTSVVIYAAKETKSGNISGGTRTAVEIAKYEGLPTFNLMNEEQKQKILHYLNRKLVQNNLSERF